MPLEQRAPAEFEQDLRRVRSQTDSPARRADDCLQTGCLLAWCNPVPEGKALGVKEHPADRDIHDLAPAADDGVGDAERGRQPEQVAEEDDPALLHAERARHEDAERFRDTDERLHRQRLAEINRHSQQMRHEQNLERVRDPAGEVGGGAEQKVAPIFAVEFKNALIQPSQTLRSLRQSTHGQESGEGAKHPALLKPDKQRHDDGRQRGDRRAFQRAPGIPEGE